MPATRAKVELQRMLATLRHEDFYITGTWVDESLGVYVGWTAREGSFCDHMPVRNERGDLVLVFSGEEYPDPDTARNLRERGHHFDPEGPSYLVHLCEDDPGFPAGLNGRFHGLLMDRRREIVTLFNDRYGMHRIHFHESKGALYFAAEAKAILAVRPELRRLDPQGLAEFIACGCVLEDRSLFSGIRVLPPASAWVLRKGAVERKNSYFHPREWEEHETLSPEMYYTELRTVFLRNLSRYFDGSERVAMSLTGGLDTRIVMAGRRPEPGSLPCYTFGGMLRDCRDVIVGRKVADMCCQPHQVIRVGEDFLSQFGRYAERAVYLTDGCVDVSRAPDLYLNERARQIAPVRMTGLYGGEILRKVCAFECEVPQPGVFQPEVHSHAEGAREVYKQLLGGHPVSFAAFQQCPWYLRGSLALEETQVAMSTPFLDNDFVRMVSRAPQSALATDKISVRLIADGNPELLRIPTDRGIVGSRSRFFCGPSRVFQEFMFKAEYAYDVGMPQWLVRADHALPPLRLQRFFLGKHKISHFRIWYRHQLGRYVREILLDPSSLSRPYIERKGLEAVVRDHLAGSRNYTTEIHRLLALELLHRLFVDGRPLPHDSVQHSGEPDASPCRMVARS